MKRIFSCWRILAWEIPANESETKAFGKTQHVAT